MVNLLSEKTTMMHLPVLFIISLLSFGEGSRILLVTVPGRSHVHYFATVGRELVARGHEVHVLLSTSIEEVVKDLSNIIGTSMTIHTVAADWEDPLQNGKRTEEEVKNIISISLKYDISNFVHFRFTGWMISNACHNVLSDEILFVSLRNLKFDFAMIDGFPALRCQYVLLYRLGIPYVSLTTQYEPWQFGIPALPSTVPLAVIHDFTEQMSFPERVRNFLSYVEWHTIPLVWTNFGYYTSKYAPEMPYKSPNQLAAESALWFINTDIAIDYARPTVPHVIEVGGLTTKPSNKALPQEIQTFMDNASSDGVILVSFGSSNHIPDELENLIRDAVLKLDYHVIWKTSKFNLTKANIITSEWIPQNAILAHPKIKLFITHGGNNGQFEALYHGVPMIVIPVFGDQFYNAKRAQYKGYGIIKQALGTTVEELLEAVDEVLSNPKYKENIKRGSEIYRSHPMNPRERLVYWMEHVMEYGAHYLHSYSLQMPWYQYWMIDIAGFLFVCLVAAMYLIYRILKSCSKCMTGSRKSKSA